MSSRRKRTRPVLGEEKTEIIVGKKAKRYPAAVARKVARNWMKSNRKESKFLDTTTSATEMNYDAVFSQAINLIVQGDTINTRDGNRVKLTGIQLKGLIKFGAESVADSHVARVLVVYDKRANLGGVAGTTSILTTAGAATDVYQLRNRATGLTQRFKVLKDIMVNRADLGVVVDTNTESACYVFEWFIPIEALVEYGATAGATSDVQTGLVTVYGVSNVAAANAGPTIEYRARVSFVDM